MSDRVNAIYKCYTDLEYDKNNDVSINYITLSQKVTHDYEDFDYDNFAKRFFNTASVIKENLAYFNCYCQHIDEITTIVEYLINFGCQLYFNNLFDNEYTIDEVIKAVIFTLFSICTDSNVLQFLKNAIVKDSILEKYRISDVSLSQTIDEMILLRDADLYAVVSYLKMKTAKHYRNGNRMKIWVQQLIKEKFLWLKEKYCKDQEISICVFKSTKDLPSLFTSKTFDKINILSIWSEDIIVATNLAASLNRDVVFINTYMDFSGGVILLPHVKLLAKTLYKHMECSLDVCPFKADVQSNDKYRKLIKDPCCQDVFRNLFYDGMWQRPVKEMYWIYKKHDTHTELWAKATCDDINRCINSAEKGFKIWSVMSTERRLQILLKFVSMLERSCKFELKFKVDILTSSISNSKLKSVDPNDKYKEMISKLMHFLSTCENSLSRVQNGRLEVMTVRKPRGVIVIKESNKFLLLWRMIASLFAGNSVIVICDYSYSRFMSYWDMFPFSDIPPGVVNLLSSEKSKDLELILCGMDYESYEKRFFTENEFSTYINLTLPKHIVRSFK